MERDGREGEGEWVERQKVIGKWMEEEGVNQDRKDLPNYKTGGRTYTQVNFGLTLPRAGHRASRSESGR